MANKRKYQGIENKFYECLKKEKEFKYLRPQLMSLPNVYSSFQFFRAVFTINFVSFFFSFFLRAVVPTHAHQPGVTWPVWTAMMATSSMNTTRDIVSEMFVPEFQKLP